MKIIIMILTLYKLLFLVLLKYHNQLLSPMIDLYLFCSLATMFSIVPQQRQEGHKKRNE